MEERYKQKPLKKKKKLRIGKKKKKLGETHAKK